MDYTNTEVYKKLQLNYRILMTHALEDGQKRFLEEKETPTLFEVYFSKFNHLFESECKTCSIKFVLKYYKASGNTLPITDSIIRGIRSFYKQSKEKCNGECKRSENKKSE